MRGSTMVKWYISSSQSDNTSLSPTVAIAACLGNDQLGREANRRLALKNVRTDYLQFDDEWETGMATAILDDNGDATYEFNTPAVWDGLQLEGRLKDALMSQTRSSSMSSEDDGNEKEGREQSTKVYIMGTIAARLQNEHEATSSSTLAAIRNGAPEDSVVLDVNLRSPWYTSGAVLELARGEASSLGDDDDERGGESSQEAKKLALLKLNEEELCILEGWCGLESGTSRSSVEDENNGLSGSILKERMEQLASSLNAQRICVTRGKDGAALLCKEENDGSSSLFYENSGFNTLSVNNDADTVGAGDAFLAALVSSLFVQNETPERALERACALGGYVAGCWGATPEHGDAPEDLRRIISASI